MKFVSALAVLSMMAPSSCLAFAPSPAFSSHTKLAMSDNNSGMDLSGNTWKPDSATMGVSTVIILFFVFLCTLV